MCFPKSAILSSHKMLRSIIFKIIVDNMYCNSCPGPGSNPSGDRSVAGKSIPRGSIPRGSIPRGSIPVGSTPMEMPIILRPIPNTGYLVCPLGVRYFRIGKGGVRRSRTNN